MKLNIADPRTGQQLVLDVDDQRKLLPFFDKMIGSEVPGDSLGGDFVGTTLQITGGNDVDGFPMMQGILQKKRVRLLFRDMPKKGKLGSTSSKGKSGEKKGATKAGALRHAIGNCNSKCTLREKHFRPQRKGQMFKKSIRGCIVGPDLAVLNLILSKSKGAAIPGLSDAPIPRRLGPKRASHIRKLFNRPKTDDVRKLVIFRTFYRAGGDKEVKRAPKIQRLITEARLQRKRRQKSVIRQRHQAAAEAKLQYEKLLKKRTLKLAKQKAHN